MSAYDDWVTVYRPELPPADAIADYIRRADAARFYTNRGPLVRELEARLAGAFGQRPEALRTTSTGTSAIEAAILATAGPASPERPLALVPSYTFAATGLAAERCGYRVALVDVDPASWCLTPASAAADPRLAQVGVVLPVAAFGRMPDIAGFGLFQAETGVPVVIDAAAATEALMDDAGLVSSTVPLTLSFHATKTFSTGEGGAVVWADADGQARVEQVSNFGFRYSRECKVAGLNAKLSEYHAAVGLAMLDGFDARRNAYAGVLSGWHTAMAGVPGRLHTAPDLASVYVLWEAPDAATMEAAEAALIGQKIEARRWYESGLHLQTHFHMGNRPPMPVTEDISARLLGLPMSHDLSREKIRRIAGEIANMAGARSGGYACENDTGARRQETEPLPSEEDR